MNNPFHTIGVIIISALVGSGVAWVAQLPTSNPLVYAQPNVPSPTVSSAFLDHSVYTPTIVVVYPPTSDSPVYNIVVAHSNVVNQTIVIVPR